MTLPPPVPTPSALPCGGVMPVGKGFNRLLAGVRPPSVLLRKLVDWVRLYLGYELDWDVRLALARTEVPPLSLDGRTQLGWTTWLGRRRAAGDAADLSVDAERFVDPA